MTTSPAASAWKIPPSYHRGLNEPIDPWQRQRVRWAIIAIQRELIAQGYLKADPAKLNGGFGPLTEAAVRAFQTKAGLVVDGDFGRKSARRLFLPLYIWWQAILGIPDMLLYGQGGLESGFDPGAEGANPKGWDWYDRGIHQLNRHWRPEVPDAVAFGDAGWCIANAGSDLKANYVKLGNWDCAIAAHNNPTLAGQWARGEKAPTTQLLEYVAYVRENAAEPF